MKETHHESLVRYVNNVIAMERDIVNAVRTQLEDERVGDHPLLKTVFLDLAVHADHRASTFEKLMENEGGSLGGSLKEGLAAVTGIVTGLYGMARVHPLSRMVRDNIVAMNVASVSYSMLVTLGIAIDHDSCRKLATDALNDCPEFVLKLTDLLPDVVLEEIADDAPVPNAMAARTAGNLIRESWKNRS